LIPAAESAGYCSYCSCVDLAGSPDAIEWPSSLSAAQRTHLTSQWLDDPEGPLSDEWIPDEWLLRAYTTPAMAAVDLKRGELGSRVFELDAEPVMLGRSISAVIPELGLAGVRQFRVRREVPTWWLYGPEGADVLALLRQYHCKDVIERVLAATHDHREAWRNLAPFGFVNDVLAVADATRHVGAVTLASALTRGAAARHGQLAADRAYQAAVGLIVRDVLPAEASRLYLPWWAVFGTSSAEDTTLTDAAYPVEA
jgi:hypothetical protein